MSGSIRRRGRRSPSLVDYLTAHILVYQVTKERARIEEKGSLQIAFTKEKTNEISKKKSYYTLYEARASGQFCVELRWNHD